jgi:hypothetical protein
LFCGLIPYRAVVSQLARRRMREQAMPRIRHLAIVCMDPEALARSWKVVGPAPRPPDRAYAELRATDPEGNNFDLAEGGFERSAAGGGRKGAPATA